MPSLNLIDSRPFNMKKFPAALESHIEFLSTCELDRHEIEIFHLSLNALAAAIESEHKDLGEMFVNCLIIDSDTFSLQLSPADSTSITLGCQINLIIYPIHRWRIRRAQGIDFGDGVMVASILEELCHYFYTICDEDRVKEKVIQVAKYIHSGITAHHLYPWLF